MNPGLETVERVTRARKFAIHAAQARGLIQRKSTETHDQVADDNTWARLCDRLQQDSRYLDCLLMLMKGLDMHLGLPDSISSLLREIRDPLQQVDQMRVVAERFDGLEKIGLDMFEPDPLLVAAADRDVPDPSLFADPISRFYETREKDQ